MLYTPLPAITQLQQSPLAIPAKDRRWTSCESISFVRTVTDTSSAVCYVSLHSRPHPSTDGITGARSRADGPSLSAVVDTSWELRVGSWEYLSRLRGKRQTHNDHVFSRSFCLFLSTRNGQRATFFGSCIVISHGLGNGTTSKNPLGGLPCSAINARKPQATRVART